jgi:hypothetical protein
LGGRLRGKTARRDGRACKFFNDQRSGRETEKPRRQRRLRATSMARRRSCRLLDDLLDFTKMVKRLTVLVLGCQCAAGGPFDTLRILFRGITFSAIVEILIPSLDRAAGSYRER